MGDYDWMSVNAPTDGGNSANSAPAGGNNAGYGGDSNNVVTNTLASQVVPPAAVTGPTTTYSAPNGNQLSPVEQQIVKTVQKVNPQLDPMLAVAIKRVEDANEDPNATSSKGAKGIMQVMPSTRANLIAAGKLAPDADNITAGVTALSEMAKEVGYDPLKLGNYYHSGHAGVNGTATGPESTAYMPKVATAYQQLTGKTLGNSATIAGASDVGASDEKMGLSPLPGIQAANAVGNLTSQVSNFVTDFLKQANIITKDTNVAQQADLQFGQASANAEMDKQAHMQQAADLSASHQSDLGTNSKDPNTYVMNGVFRQLRSALVTQQQNLDLYNQSKQESFWDNPLQHIKFAIFGNDYAKKANAAGEVINDLSHSIQQMAQDRADQDSNDKAATSQISYDMAADAAKQALARATATAAAFGVQGANAIMGAESHMTLGLGTASQAATQLHSLQVQAHTTATTNEAQTLAISKAKKEERDTDALVNNLKSAIGMLGGDPSKINSMYLKTAPRGQIEALNKVFTSGRAASDPATAIDIIHTWGNPDKLPDQTSVAYNYLRQQWSKYYAVATTTPGFDRKNPNVIIGPKLAEQMNTEAALPDMAPLQSPYHIASPKVMLQVPAIANDPIAKVLAPVALTGNKNVPANDILNTTLDAMTDGHISLDDAAKGLAKYYQTAIGINNKAFDHNLLGLKPQQHYMAKIDGLSSPIDMIDPVKIKWALQRLQTQQTSQQWLNMFE